MEGEEGPTSCYGVLPPNAEALLSSSGWGVCLSSPQEGGGSVCWMAEGLLLWHWASFPLVSWPEPALRGCETSSRADRRKQRTASGWEQACSFQQITRCHQPQGAAASHLTSSLGLWAGCAASEQRLMPLLRHPKLAMASHTPNLRIWSGSVCNSDHSAFSAIYSLTGNILLDWH